MGKRINMVRPDGTTVSVPANKLASFLYLGYREEGGHESVERLTLEAEKEYYSGTGQQVLAGVEGVASGLTLGLADLAMDDEATRKRAAYNPKTRLAGEIVGGVAPALFTGGESFLAKALTATPTGALTKGAMSLGGKGARGMVVGGAIEGTVAGAMGEITRSSLSGDPLTVEGALAGAGLGFVFGTSAGALGAGLQKAGRGFVPGKTVEEDFVDAMLGGGSAAQHAAPEVIGRAEFRPPNMYPHAKSAIEAQDAAARGLIPDEKFQLLRKTVKDLDKAANDLANQAFDTTAALKSHMAKLEEAGEVYYAKAMASPSRVKQGVSGTEGHLKADKSHLVNTKPDPLDIGELNTGIERRTLAQDVRTLRGAMKTAMGKGTPAQVQAAAEKYRAAIGRLAASFGGEVPPAMTQQAISSIDAVVDFQQAVSKLNMPTDANSFFRMGPDKAEELFARINAVLKAGVPEARPLQEQLSQVIDQLAESTGVIAQKGDTTTRLRSVWSTGHQVHQQAGRAWDDHHLFTPGKADTAQFDEAGKRFWGDEMGEAINEANKLGSKAPPGHTKPKKARQHGIKGQLERAAAHAAISGVTGRRAAWLLTTLVSAKAAALDRIAAAVARWGEPMGDFTRRVGARAEPLYRSFSGHQDPEGDLKAAFAARSKELRDLMVTGRDRAFMTSQELTALGHGEFGLAAYEHAYNVVDGLTMKLPKSPPGTTWGTEYLWEVPDEQLAVFNQEYEAGTAPVDFIERALEDPQAVFPSAVEVLANSWPALYAEVRGRIMEKIMLTGTSQYDHGDLVGLSVFLATPLVPTMDAGFIQDHAAMLFTPPPQPKPTGPSGQSGRPPGMNPDATKAQALEAR